MDYFTNDTYTNSDQMSWSASIDPSQNCMYLNKSNNKIILDTYEGIPQNLIFAVLGWLALLVLFTLLREKAGNYGRIALVQRADDNLRWTQVFFGSADDITAGVLGTNHLETASIGSREFVYYRDRGAFSWVAAIFNLSTEDIVKKCGPSAGRYLSFQKHIICFMFIMMCSSLIIVLPINFQGDLEGDVTYFGHTTISNLSPESPLLWVHVILAILYLPLAIYLMRRFSSKATIQETRVTESKTVMIVHIPRKGCDTADLHRHFAEAYPNLQVDDIQLAYDITEICKLDRERDRIFQARQFCVDFQRRTNSQLKMKPYACGYICGCCDCGKVDALEFYNAEETRLYDAVDSARNAALKRPLGIAFVTFVTIGDAKAFLLSYKRRFFGREPERKSSLLKQLRPQWWHVSYAPDNSDILWENLSVPLKHWYIRAFIINFLLFIFLFFLTTPVYILNLFNTISFNDVIGKMNPLLAQFVPTIILAIVAAFLPAMVSFSDRFLCHWTRSKQNHSMMLKSFILLLFMVFILPAIGLTSAKAFVDWTWHWQNETYRWECLSLPDKGAFFVNYVMTASFIGTALELLRFSELFIYAVRFLLVRSRAELSSLRKEVLWEYPFGIHYSWILLIFSMTTMYSLFCPLITPFGLLYMLLKHAVDKYNLYFAYSPSKTGSEIHATAINCVIFSVVLVQGSFLAFSYLRQGFNPVTIISLTAFCITILSFIVMVFFSCCKGFNPISYEFMSVADPSQEEVVLRISVPVPTEIGLSVSQDDDRRSDSATSSPVRPGGSRWFVPDILNAQDTEPSSPGEHPRSYGSQDVPVRVLLRVDEDNYQEDSAGV